MPTKKVNSSINKLSGFGPSEAYWVWPCSVGDQVNQYVEFKHEFRLGKPDAAAELLISVESNYAVWINDCFVDCGQFHNYPDRKTFDRLPVGKFLKGGTNRLLIVTYYQGEESFQYLKGSPGLIYTLRAGGKTFASGTSTAWRRSTGYFNGPITRINSQLGFTFQYDAQAAAGAAQSGWQAIETGDITGDASTRGLMPRPLPKLSNHEPKPAVICAQGLFTRPKPGVASDKTVAQIMQQDGLSQRFAREMFADAQALQLPSQVGVTVLSEHFNADGIYIIVDLGREEAGLLSLDIQTDDGAILDIAYGEHLDDLRVRAYVGRRNFANRYICKKGRQQFTHHLSRLAGRYVQLNVSNTKQFTLYYAGLCPTEYPIDLKGQFQCADSMYERIYQTSVRTLHLCMHEHYEDCPWREQALYAFDSRNQALYGYYAFGEYPFVASSFSLLGESLAEDGYMEMCAPAKIDITIPMFSLAWVLAVDDYWMHSAELSFVQRAFVWTRQMLEVHLARMSGGLLPSSVGERYWHFYEWVPGLDGGDRLKPSDPPRYDAPLNLMFALALAAGSRLADAVGDHQTAKKWNRSADSLCKQIAKAFWDAKAGAFRSYTGKGTAAHYAEFVQSLALLARIPIGTAAANKLRARLASEDNGLIATTLSHCHYKFEALMMQRQKYGKWVFDAINRDWGEMLLRGATSFWETIRGGDDFSQAGSLCHGWSAVPVYFYMTQILGIRPLAPGFSQFVIDPLAGVVPAASGVVPTPAGPITVSWTQENNTLQLRKLSYPKSLKANRSRVLANKG